MNKALINCWAGSAASPYGAEYTTLLSRASALGYTAPSASQKTKQDTLITDLKAAGVWALLDVFYVFSTDGDHNYACLNWISPTANQITEVGGPTFTVNHGFNGNGTTQYLRTGWIPSNGVNYTQNSASFGGYCDTEGAENGFFCACQDGIPNVAYLIPRRTADDRIQAFINDGTTYTNSVGSTIAKAFFLMQRTASNITQVYVNGVGKGAGTGVSTGRPTVEMDLLGRNNNGVHAASSAKVIGCWFAGASLTGKEAAFYTAWNTYFTSL